MKRWTVLAALLVAGGLVQAAEATAAKKDLVKKVDELLAAK